MKVRLVLRTNIKNVETSAIYNSFNISFIILVELAELLLPRPVRRHDAKVND